MCILNSLHKFFAFNHRHKTERGSIQKSQFAINPQNFTYQLYNKRTRKKKKYSYATFSVSFFFLSWCEITRDKYFSYFVFSDFPFCVFKGDFQMDLTIYTCAAIRLSKCFIKLLYNKNECNSSTLNRESKKINKYLMRLRKYKTFISYSRIITFCEMR